jgi:TolB-like protein/Tfp pilus assembly protein PilF
VVALVFILADRFWLSTRLAEQSAAPAVAGTEQVATEPETSVEPDHSIAVLPFVNMSDDAGNEYFADGLAEELLNMLVKIPGLRVAARTSSFSFKNKDLKISEIAGQLNVNYILEGSVRKSGDKVRITAQLIKADEGYHLWSESFDRTLNDIFKVQDEIATMVAQALKVSLLGNSLTKRMIDPKAYVLYLKGRHFLTLSSAGDLRRAEEFLLQAVELDTEYAEAWAYLAMCYFWQISSSAKTRGEGVPLAMNAIERAKSIDPDLGIAWGVYSYLKNHLDWDWSVAQAAINKAHELEPNNNLIRRWRASTAHTLGKLDEAIELYEQAILNDPLSMGLYSALGNIYMKVHRYDEAIETFEKQAELDPTYYWVYFNLGKSFLLKGDSERALLEIKKNPENVFRIVGLVMAYSTLGREAEAEIELQRLIIDYVENNPVWIAEAYSWRGQNDEAFDWLEMAYMQRDISLTYMLGNNVLNSLNDDPRWTDLLNRMNLLQYWLDMPAGYGGPTKPQD